jgi:hypothetical protein
MTANRVLPAVSIAALTMWLSALAIRLPPRDGDLLWQRWLGERILRDHAIPRTLGPEAFAASGAPWTPQEWLFSLGLASTAHQGAAWIVPLACALAAGLALVITALRCRRRGTDGVMTSAAVILCALSMLQSFGARAQVFGWCGCAVVLWLLELDSILSWLAVPVTIVWANLHASVFLAPLLATVFACMKMAQERTFQGSATRLFGITVGCAAATLATPLGTDLPRYAAGLLASPIRHSISEWAPTSLENAVFVIAALPLLIMLVAFGNRAPPHDRVLACIFLVILFTAVRNVPLFALVVAPIAFGAMPAQRPTQQDNRLRHAAAWAATVTVALAGLGVSVISWQRAPALADGLPYAPAHAATAGRDSRPRIFCEDFAWCSLFLTARAATVFIDGRADPYPVEIWHQYRDVIDGKPDWSQILDQHCIDTVLARRKSALESLLAEDTAWVASIHDRHAALYVRKNLTLCPRSVNAQTTGRSASMKSDGRS